MATLLAIVDPGDEVIVFEPFYENYGPDAILSGAMPRFVRLHEPDWTFDPDELAARSTTARAPSSSTRRTTRPGKVFTRDELDGHRARSASKWDVIAITDEIYEHILYDGAEHVPMAALDGMADRTVTINSLSKTFSVTGWRVGWAISPPALTGRDPEGARLSHRRRAGAAAGGGRRRAGAAGRYYVELAARLPAAARHDDSTSCERHGFTLLPADGRVLHDDRHRRVRVSATTCSSRGTW